MKARQIIIVLLCFLSMCIIAVLVQSCGENGRNEKKDSVSDENVLVEGSKPLNISIFVDLSDRIKKEKDGMAQSEKDQRIINGIAESFIEKQSIEGFSKNRDCFQVVFYPAPDSAQALAENLSLDLNNIKGPKKKPLVNFKNTHTENIAKLYSNALAAEDFFGSDIWGYFNNDKVNDLCKDGYRNVLIILSDGYIFDANNKIIEGKNYSYILPNTLAIKGEWTYSL